MLLPPVENLYVQNFWNKETKTIHPIELSVEKDWFLIDDEILNQALFVKLAALNSGSNSPLDILSSVLDSVKFLVVYDWFHNSSSLSQRLIDGISELATVKPLIWSTVNKKIISGLPTRHFDYYWNWCKHGYLGRPTWKQKYRENLLVYPINEMPRTHQFLTLSRRYEKYRFELNKFLKSRPAFTGFGTKLGYTTIPVQGKITNDYLLPNKGTIEELQQGLVALPARHYLDSTYISCQVETVHLGTNAVSISEKTYDHLIQGRCVLNFATAGFYQCLINDGWKMPTDIDLSWDSISDDDERFAAYLRCLESLLSLSATDLHDWFLSNMPCWTHNQQMLYTKPYNTAVLSK